MVKSGGLGELHWRPWLWKMKFLQGMRVLTDPPIAKEKMLKERLHVEGQGSKLSKHATINDAPTKPSKEVCVGGMVQRRLVEGNAVIMDALTMLSMEEFAPGMGQKGQSAVIKDAPTSL
mgnify:CR=1 FL=1